MTARPAPRALVETSLPLSLYARGKVRDLYDAGDCLLMVATDRISAFDHVLPTPVPGKGRILTQLSAFWFEATRGLAPNHYVTADPARMPARLGAMAAPLDGRAMLVRRARRLDVECIVRGYLAGAGWQEYRQTGAICGVRLPAGLREGDRLAAPIFTPAAKAAGGHDHNITFDEVVALLGAPLAEQLRARSLALYAHGHAHAAACGLVLADTKFEFGLLPGEGATWPGGAGAGLLVIDELLTPDSSRFWEAADYRRGTLVALDKQFVRDYLLRSGWDRQSPPPPLPLDVVEATQQRYRETYRRLTGREIT
ncbi:MAG: phosphoribosylaminoimidazolesuccinocarboxamide synthase [Armatimonadota bacterium]|nr:phosphoribosylaminoimidazolesuccinocarboxamide synthase [Armatimonadota bacterium]MDR7533590.1 phosphoribosylaminoimidazolesuccinocarboxamide synthase [Armatimonadota bacterium]MDR7537390.1 phosphoribosylaminoimidazolesuccinocarboxamide synthase [Armatimonadota bacterium]